MVVMPLAPSPTRALDGNYKLSKSKIRKDHVIKSITSSKLFLYRIPLDISQSTHDLNHNHARKEMMNEKIVCLNGVREFKLKNFSRVCQRMCEIENVTLDPKTLEDNALVRMRLARISSKAVSYVRLSNALGSFLNEVQIQHIEHKSKQALDISMYVEGGNVNADIESTVVYGIYHNDGDKSKHKRLSTIVESSEDVNKKPWFTVSSVTTDQINFSNNNSIRTLKLFLNYV